jgi:hypothetical protein
MSEKEIDLVFISAVCPSGSSASVDAARIRAEIKDLGSRLYYCSDSGEGRKMRKWIEARIHGLERVLDGIELVYPEVEA